MTVEVTLTGMVIYSAPANEYDKRVVLLTKERGKITAFAKGAKRPKSQFAAGTRPFAFGEFTVFEGKNAYNMVSVKIERYFEEITNDIEVTYYGFYFLELADYFGMENVESSEMLLLLYQSLRALLNKSLHNKLVRRVYELKLFAVNGEYPNMFVCAKCGNAQNLDGFSMKDNGALCCDCGETDKIDLLTSTIYTMQYIISTGIGKLFTFHVSENVLKELEMVMNRFLSIYVDKELKSAEFLKIIE